MNTKGHGVLFIIAITGTIKLQPAAGVHAVLSAFHVTPFPLISTSGFRRLESNEQPQQVHGLIYLPKTEQLRAGSF